MALPSQAVKHVTQIARWSVTMKDGTEITVWSDSYEEVNGEVVFGALVDATVEEQADLDVTSRTPSKPSRVVIAIARFPRLAVESIRST